MGLASGQDSMTRNPWAMLPFSRSLPVTKVCQGGGQGGYAHTRQNRSSGGHRSSPAATPSGTQTSSAFRRLPVSIAPRAAQSADAIVRQSGVTNAAATTAGDAAPATDSGCSSGLAAAQHPTKFPQRWRGEDRGRERSAGSRSGRRACSDAQSYAHELAAALHLRQGPTQLLPRKPPCCIGHDRLLGEGSCTV